MDSQTITIEKLREIRKAGPLVIKSNDGQGINIPMLWLFYDFNTSSYVLVRRTYDSKKVRNFNHIILDDLFLEAHAAQVQEIINEAISKIEKGECFVFNSNKTFTPITECSKPHS